MSEPKLGDQVLFFRNAQHEALTATICKVHPAPDPNRPKQLGALPAPSGVLVNLFVLSEEGMGFNKIKVLVVAPTGRPESGCFCEYPLMPAELPASTAP